jgi:hypothetical protein
MHDHTDIAEALQRPGIDADPAVAHNILLSLGRHAAAGQTPPHIPTAAIAPLLAAAQGVAANLTADTSGLADLDDRWHDASSQTQADAVVAAPLELHLDALYAVEAIEAIAAETSTASVAIERVDHDLATAFAAHDRALRSNVGCLCTLADGDALKTWRRSLPPGMNPIPWWLDGSLESEAAALARRTDALAGRIATAFGSGPEVLPLAQAAAAARAIRAAAGFTLAAATAPPAGLTSHSWRHPSAPIAAVLWVPAAFDDAADLRMVFRGSTEHHEERNLVGEVVLLEGVAAVVRLERDGDAERVEASWPAHDMAALVRDSLALTDGRGGCWVPVD